MTANSSSLITKHGMRLAGAIWTGGDGLIIAKGGIAHDPAIATSGLIATGCSVTSMVLGESGKILYGPGFLASGVLFTVEALRRAPAGRWGDVGYGIGVTAGCGAMFYGQQIWNMVQATPVSRFLRKLPKLQSGKVAETILLGAYASEIANGLSQLIHGVAHKDAKALADGVTSLSLSGMFLLGNRMASIATANQVALPTPAKQRTAAPSL